jgi:hypothetical protein
MNETREEKGRKRKETFAPSCMSSDVSLLIGWLVGIGWFPISLHLPPFSLLDVLVVLLVALFLSLSFSFLDFLSRLSYLVYNTVRYVLKYGKETKNKRCYMYSFLFLLLNSLSFSSRSLVHYSLFPYFSSFPRCSCSCVAISTYSKHGHKWMISFFLLLTRTWWRHRAPTSLRHCSATAVLQRLNFFVTVHNAVTYEPFRVFQVVQLKNWVSDSDSPKKNRRSNVTEAGEVLPQAGVTRSDSKGVIRRGGPFFCLFLSPEWDGVEVRTPIFITS